MSFDSEYLLTFLESILKTPSPSGFTHLAINKVKKEAESLGYATELTPKGCLLISIPGQQTNSKRAVALSAHVDTLGAMVRSIKSKGTLRYTSIGGFTHQSVEGEYCQIFTRDGKIYTGTILNTEPSVHVFEKAGKQERTEANMEIRLDEKVSSKKEVQELGIQVGDFIAFNSRTIITAQKFVKSRHLDDKASVAILMGVMERLAREKAKPLHNTIILISTYEEVGHGASYLPSEADEMLAVDMGAIGDDLQTTEYVVSICAKDSSGPYDYELTGHLTRLAKEQDIDYAVDIYPHYMSDASAAFRAGANIRAALVGPGIHASHGLERTHLDGLMNTARLVWAYLMTPRQIPGQE
ncbi:MAG: M42 family metallopeptidase [Candidatus Hodarchaeota archaeon]